jgi:hypothetical protein
MSNMLQSILDLTDRVQTAIDQGDWQHAQELETERRAKLELLVAAGGASGDLSSALSSLEQRNHRIVGLVQHHRRRVLREASTVRTNQAAANAYANASTGDESA